MTIYKKGTAKYKKANQKAKKKRSLRMGIVTLRKYFSTDYSHYRYVSLKHYR